MIIAYNDNNGDIKLSLLDESETDKQITPVSPAAYGIFYNANATENFQTINFPEYGITNAKLYFDNSIQLAVPNTLYNLSYSGASFSFSANNFDRFFGILTSTNGAPDFFTVTNQSIAKEKNKRFERYINATDDIESLIVAKDSLNGVRMADGVARKTASNYYTFTDEKKFVYFFIDKTEMKELFRNSNFSKPTGKIYTYIIYGSKIKGYKFGYVEDN